MYERFTDRARDVMKRAHAEARRWRHDYVGTEHQLLALVKQGGGVAVALLEHANLDSTRIEREIEALLTPGPVVHRTQRRFWRLWADEDRLPQTPCAKKVVEYALDEAHRLNHNYIGTEHLLLGLMREQETIAGQVLAKLGLEIDKTREEVVSILGQVSD